MDDDGQRVHGVAVHQDVELHQGRLPVPGYMIVERSIAAGEGFQAIVKIEHDLVERQLVGDEHPVRADIFQRFLHAALLLAQLKNGADVLGRREDHRRDDWLFDLRHIAGLRQLREPRLALPRLVHISPGAGDGAAPVEGFDAVHHAR